MASEAKQKELWQAYSDSDNKLGEIEEAAELIEMLFEQTDIWDKQHERAVMFVMGSIERITAEIHDSIRKLYESAKAGTQIE